MRPIAKLLILFTLFYSTSADAQDSKNGATWYRKAIKAYNALPRDFVDSIHNWNWADTTTPISDEMRLAMAKIQPILRLVRRGSNQQYSDFNLPYDDGIDLLLPHLQPMRGITRFAMADVTIRLRDGDSASAAAELASIYRVSGHYSDDQTVISSLVGYAVFHFTDTIAQTGFDSAAFSAEDSAIMLEALNAFSEEDPFDFVEAIAMEGEMMTEWMTGKYEVEENGGAMLANAISAISPNDFNGDLREKIVNLTQDEFTESLDKIDNVMNRVVAAFLDPNEEAGKANLDKIMKEIEGGEHGVLALGIFPAFDRLFEKILYAEQKLAARKAALALLITGEMEPTQGANAVVWYFRAISMLKDIEQEKRDQWKMLATESDNIFDEEITKTLTDAEPMISIVREATQMKRCDFAAVTRNEILAIPAYLPGFRELANLLIADANRLFEIGEADAAFDRLDICLRMSAHLAKDKSIASALLSHKIFTLASTILQEPITLAFLNDVHQVLLEEALNTMGRKDPFGYITAIIAARKDAENWFWLNTHSASANKALQESVRNCDIDRLFTMIVMKWRGHGRKYEWPEAEFDTLQPIRDVLDLDALAEAVLQVPQLFEAAKAKQYKAILEKERPVISPVRERLARARGDFRKAVLALKD
ncbi:MAG: hypothetical protein IH984_00240 [Planctomycetes bacterium]|nr:hypothetical protein [Planctomycetota bacterium]